MIDVNTAVKLARDYFVKLYPNKVQTYLDVQLEEVELSKDERTWLVTIGFSRPLSGEPTLKSLSKLLGPEYKREYKIFTIDAESGKVRAMKIRAV